VVIRNAQFKTVAGSVLLTATLAGDLMALGFRSPDQNAAATAQGEAFIAQADDASAAHYNPAGLTQLAGTHAMAGGYVFMPRYRFDGPNGNDTMDDASFTPHLYLASDLGQNNFRFGLAVNVPYGNAVNWDNNGPLKYVVTEASLSVMNIAPTLAYRINDQLAVGASLNVYYGRTELNNHVPFAPPLLPATFPDGQFKFKGDGEAVGASIGVLWRPAENHSLAAIYRSPFTLDFEGEAQVRNAPAVLPSSMFAKADARAEIDFPQIAAVGYAYRPTPRWTLEVDIEWTNWETLDEVVLKSRNALDGTTIPFHWENSFFYELGVKYQLSDQWTLRAGYIFSENSVPEETFSAMVPDSDRHVVSVGCGYNTERFDLNLGYQFTVGESRTITDSVNAPANGEWSSTSHAFIFSGAVKF
jgi:long-chain fatty acid transport protein